MLHVQPILVDSRGNDAAWNHSAESTITDKMSSVKEGEKSAARGIPFIERKFVQGGETVARYRILGMGLIPGKPRTLAFGKRTVRQTLADIGESTELTLESTRMSVGSNGLKVALVGATGMVGRTMLKVMEEQELPVAELLPVASARSIGQTVNFRGQAVKVVGMEEALDAAPHVALFSAGGSVSLDWAPRFAARGITVVDNSSAWRMSPDHQLVVPEVNGGVLGDQDLVIANPNCTTMQLVMALKPLHDGWGLVRGVVSTYQSVTGTGQAAVAQLEGERAGKEDVDRVYPHPIDQNCLPHCDVFLDNGYTKEEMKVYHETKKILGLPDVDVVCTAVRVPVVGGHSESVYVELARPFELDDVRRALEAFPGVTVQDDPVRESYPMPRSARGLDDVFVGRIRRDLSNPLGLHLWIVADNLRKGAATNAVQIARHLWEQGRWS